MIIAISIPTSIIATFILMYFTGLTMNVLSLSGLAVAIGMLVDDSIVVMENIYRIRDQGVGAIAAPVFDAEGRIQCSLSLSAPVVRLDRKGFERVAPDIVEAAFQISAGLGYVK